MTQQQGKHMTPIRAAAAALAPHPQQLDQLLASLRRVLANPHDERVRKVALSSSAFASLPDHVRRLMTGFLKACGYEYMHSYLVLQRFDAALLSAGIAACEAEQGDDAYRRAKAELLEKQAAQRAKAEEAKAQEAVRKKFEALPPAEPRAGAAGTTQICFLVEDADGETRRYLTKRRFETWDTLKDLLNFARSLPGVPPREDLKLENVTVSPVVPLDPRTQRGHTLEGLGLWPSGLVLIRAAA